MEYYERQTDAFAYNRYRYTYEWKSTPVEPFIRECEEYEEK